MKLSALFSCLTLSLTVALASSALAHPAKKRVSPAPSIIGQQFYLSTGGDADVVTVVGHIAGHGYVIRYESGDMSGKSDLIGDWKTADLAKLSGCATKKFCVGDRYIYDGVSREAGTIVGILPDHDEVILRFDDGESAGHSTDVFTSRLLPIEWSQLENN